MTDLSWMAWTKPTAIFFVCIALMLIGMVVWQIISPTTQRKGILHLQTTRGDRLFISLLGSAYIHLGWIGLTDAGMLGAALLSGALFVVVFRWV